MQRLATCVVAVLVSCGAAVAVAQQVSTVEELDKTMKRVGPAQQATNKAIKSMAYADARKNIATVKQALTDAENFWVVNKRDDAVKMSKDALARLTAVEEMLSAASPDQQAVMAAMKEAGGACGACHKQYRVQDENKEYHLRMPLP